MKETQNTQSLTERFVQWEKLYDPSKKGHLKNEIKYIKKVNGWSLCFCSSVGDYSEKIDEGNGYFEVLKAFTDERTIFLCLWKHSQLMELGLLSHWKHSQFLYPN